MIEIIGKYIVNAGAVWVSSLAQNTSGDVS